MESVLPEKLLSQTEAAAILGLLPRTLEHWRWQGKGPAYFRVAGGRVRYDAADVRKWLDAQRVEPPLPA